MSTKTADDRAVRAGDPGAGLGPAAGRLGGWRVAIRIARRDAWRSKGRSLMVLAMIALPIVGVSAADITIRSSELTPQQTITRDMGAADARMTDAGMGPQPIVQSPAGDEYMPPREAGDDGTKDGEEGAASSPGVPAVADPAKAMPPGARWITDRNEYAGIRTRSGLLYATVRELDPADPIAAGIMELDRGRYPRTTGEMMATNAFLDHSGLHVGSKVSAFGLDRVYRIVGAYDLPSDLGTEQLDTLPGGFIRAYTDARHAAGADADSGRVPTYLVSVPGGFTWDMVQKANTRGVVVSSRAVRLRPPADSAVPLYRLNGVPGAGPTSDRAAVVAATATVVGLAMLEICLLAGPAFAVGARRSRRQLGLVGANGGDRRHIRAIVLSGGLVIGVAAAVVGTLLGAALTLLLRGTLEEQVGNRFGGIVLRPWELLGIAGLAVLTGVLAAIVPAVTSSRQSVLASLTGRRGVRHSSRVLPVVGLVAVGLGGLLALMGSVWTNNAYAVGAGSGIAELGVVAMTPLLVGAFGRLGKWLPLGPRLALRDAVRNRGRTAPAVAAVLAAVAGTVAVATYAVSQDRQEQDAYQARAPRGVLALSVPSGQDQDQDLRAMRAAVEKRYPVASRVDVSRLTAGTRVCAPYSSQLGCGSVELVTPEANRCPMNDQEESAGLTLAQRRALASDWRCAPTWEQTALNTDSGVMVGGSDTLHALGIHDAAADRALARGQAVVLSRVFFDHGFLGLRLITNTEKPVLDKDGRQAGPVTSLPAHLLSGARSYGVNVLVPPAAAATAGLRTAPLGSLYTTSVLPGRDAQQGLSSDLAKLGTDGSTYLEQGYVGKNSLVLVALLAFAGLVTIGAAGIATGLAQADAEPDLRTLAAIGAAPRVRRALSGFQCGVIAAMGVVLGTAAGILPAVALRRTERQREWKIYHAAVDQGWGASAAVPHVPVVVPWGTLGLLLLLVPLGAALLASLVTRSQRQIGRRAEA